MVQRVSRASVTIDDRVVGSITTGLLVLLGVEKGDTDDDADWLAAKIASLRIFDDEAGRFDRELSEVGGSILVVSQFTVLGDARKGKRPNFTRAADPGTAERLYVRFTEAARRLGHEVQTGEFAAQMRVELVNEGPVTLIVDR